MWLGYSGLTSEEIGAIQTSMLILTGDRDEIVPFELILKLHSALPQSELAVVPNAGHLGPFTPERAPIFTTLISDFVERQRDARNEEE